MYTAEEVGLIVGWFGGDDARWRAHVAADAREVVNVGHRLALDPLTYRLLTEIARQDEKHGPYEGTALGRSRLALATLQDEVAEALAAWRSERWGLNWKDTRDEVLQVAAVAMRTLRDAL